VVVSIFQPARVSNTYQMSPPGGGVYIFIGGGTVPQDFKEKLYSVPASKIYLYNKSSRFMGRARLASTYAPDSNYWAPSFRHIWAAPDSWAYYWVFILGKIWGIIEN
jgi:hypothetical protein